MRERGATTIELAEASLCPFYGGMCRHWLCMAWESFDRGEPGYCLMVEHLASIVGIKDDDE